MATLTPNLKLRLSDDLTSDARFNLNRIDSLASVFLTDSTGTSVIRSQSSIQLQPNSADIGGSGVGGTISAGSSVYPISLFDIYADVIDFNGGQIDNFSFGNLLSLILDANSTFTTTLQADQSTQATNLTFTLPATIGSAGQALVTDGAGNLSFSSLINETLANNNIEVGNGSNERVALNTSATGDILVDSSTGLTIKSGVISNPDINSSASIDYSKLATLTADRALVSTGSGVVSTSAVTATELGYLSGASSSIQTQLTNITATNISTAANSGLSGGGDLTTSRSLVIDADNLVAETSPDDADYVIIYDNSAAATKKITRADLLPGRVTADYVTGDGASKAVSHNLSTKNIIVQLFDTVTDETVYPDSVVRTDADTVTIGLSSAPTNTIKVLIIEV